MIRVFARKTKWTPTDELAFYDEPPLFDMPDVPVRVNCTFTWDRDKAIRLSEAWSHRFKDVKYGGPAFGDPGGEYVPGRFLAKSVTITSRGCPKNCPWCYVPKREGGIREIPIRDGWVVQDNNLLACSRGHIEKVFEMLAGQKLSIQFKGGLDIDYLKPCHVDLLKTIKVAELWVACDRKEDLPRMDKAADLLGDFSIDKKRCYVLLGFRGEPLQDAEARCEAVYQKGFLPFAQLYRDDLTHHKPKFVWPLEWKQLERKWCRPAIYRSKQGRSNA